MTREEFYLNRRYFRAICARFTQSCPIGTLLPDHIIWHEMWQFRPEWKFDMAWKVKHSSGMKCNIKYLPNSYPHETKNP